MANKKSPPNSIRNKLLIWPLLVSLLCFASFVYFSNNNSSFIFPILGQRTVSSSGLTIATAGNPDIRTCDLSNGTWVRDYGGTAYTNMTCKFIPDNLNCEKYGKDHDFVKWRWKPYGCNLPRFDPKQFLNTMRGMTLAFFGDSNSRYQKDSLLCLLSQVESAKNTYMYNKSETELTKWYLETYNFTVLHAWSRFLVRTEERKVNGSEPEINLFLDEVDLHWVNQMHQANYVVLSGGHWFFRQLYLHEHNKLIGWTHNSDKGIPNLGMMFAYRRAFRTALNYVKYNAGKDLRLVLVRTFSPSHFEGGDWKTGGGCERTRPNLETGPLSGFLLEMRNTQLEELEWARNRNEAEHVRFVAMDVTWAMEMRPDGHPGTYFDHWWNPDSRDCLHWCMPGVIDTWNEIFLQTLKNVETSLVRP